MIWKQDALPTTGQQDTTAAEWSLRTATTRIVPANFGDIVFLTCPRNRTDVVAKSSSVACAFVFLCLSLTVGVSWLSFAPLIAQTTTSTQPSSGISATSPLAVGSTVPAGIPLGATEIATPGISPVSPSLGVGMGTCAGSNAAALSGAPFDGGGLSGNTSLSCADSRIPPSPLPSSSSAGRVGIPLGAIEIGGAGISPVAPVASPNLSTNAATASGPGKP
jgi:hypothetical protein